MSAVEPTSVDIRAAVEFEIGKPNMQDFELWAFKRSPVVYDEDTPFIFCLSRSTKMELPENSIEAMAKIIHLWKHRHDWKRGGS